MAPGQVQIVVMNGRDVTNKATFGSQSVYVVIRCGPHSGKTKTVKGNHPDFSDPISAWNVDSSDELEVRMYVARSMGSDTLLGSTRLRLDEAAKLGTATPVVDLVDDQGKVVAAVALSITFRPAVSAVEAAPRSKDDSQAVPGGSMMAATGYPAPAPALAPAAPVVASAPPGPPPAAPATGYVPYPSVSGAPQPPPAGYPPAAQPSAPTYPTYVPPPAPAAVATPAYVPQPAAPSPWAPPPGYPPAPVPAMYPGAPGMVYAPPPAAVPMPTYNPAPAPAVMHSSPSPSRPASSNGASVVAGALAGAAVATAISGSRGHHHHHRGVTTDVRVRPGLFGPTVVVQRRYR